MEGDKLFTTQLRSQFHVALFSDHSMVLESEPDLARSGYQFHRLSLMRESLERIKKEKLDVVVLDAAAVEGDVSLYAERILQSAPEVLIIAVVESVDEGLSLKGQAYDFILRPFVRSETLLMLIDKACEKIYFQNRVEKLVSVLSREGDSVKSFAEPSTPAQKAAPLAVNTQTGHLIDLLEEARDPKEAVKRFIEFFYKNVDQQPLLFFKHLQSHRSLGVSLSAGVALEKVRGVGLSLRGSTEAERNRVLRSPQLSEPLRGLMKEAFNCESYEASPLLVDGSVYGWVVKFGRSGDQQSEAFFYSMLRIAEKIIENKSLKFRMHSLQTHEADTELMNRSALHRQVTDEVARSRRTRLPVSLILLAIDDFSSFEKQAGSESVLRLRQSIASLLRKTSRITDIAADLTGGEFALLMPHTHQEGAAVKAEKLRRVVEASRFASDQDHAIEKITVSLGVSEYPGFCGDADSLMKSADDALFHVKGLKGNRVCRAKKPEAFVPDFEAREVTR